MKRSAAACVAVVHRLQGMSVAVAFTTVVLSTGNFLLKLFFKSYWLQLWRTCDMRSRTHFMDYLHTQTRKACQALRHMILLKLEWEEMVGFKETQWEQTDRRERVGKRRNLSKVVFHRPWGAEEKETLWLSLVVVLQSNLFLRTVFSLVEHNSTVPSLSP